MKDKSLDMASIFSKLNSGSFSDATFSQLDHATRQAFMIPATSGFRIVYTDMENNSVTVTDDRHLSIKNNDASRTINFSQLEHTIRRAFKIPATSEFLIVYSRDMRVRTVTSDDDLDHAFILGADPFPEGPLPLKVIYAESYDMYCQLHKEYKKFNAVTLKENFNSFKVFLEGQVGLNRWISSFSEIELIVRVSNSSAEESKTR